MVTLTLFASCVKDDVYVPPAVEGGDIVLNEIMAKDPVTDLDWIELYNKSDVEIDISGYLVYDKAQPIGGYAIPEGTIISAKGYYILYEGENFKFGISSSGEDVSLGEPDGKLIDYVYCLASQADGTTFSRIPDGGDIWLNGTEATPGAANIGDASIPSITVDFKVAPAAGDPVEVTVDFTTTETVSDVIVFYATGDTPAYNAENKISGVITANSATITMTDLNVAGKMVYFFAAVTLDNGNVYYYDNTNKNVDLSVLTADVTAWNTYTPIAGDVSAPTLSLTYSTMPTAGYETVELEYTAEINIEEVRIYFASGDNPEYIKNNRIKGEDDPSFTQTGVTLSMANLDVKDTDGNTVGNSSDLEKLISFYVRIVLANGTEFYYDKDGNVIVDDEANGGDPAAADAFKGNPSLWNTYTNKAAVTVSSLTFPANPSATDDINVVVAYASNEEIVEARIYYAGSEGLYVKDNRIKGEDDASFTQTGVTINLRDKEVLKTDGTVDGTTSTSGATIRFYVRIATATSEYYFADNGQMLAVDDSPADGAFDSSDAFKDNSSLWDSYTVQ